MHAVCAFQYDLEFVGWHGLKRQCLRPTKTLNWPAEIGMVRDRHEALGQRKDASPHNPVPRNLETVGHGKRASEFIIHHAFTH